MITSTHIHQHPTPHANHRQPQIGIITLNGYHNYGNRLQNYALSHTLAQLGFQPVTLWRRSFLQSSKDFIKALLPFKRYQRFRNFYRFSRTYIPSARYVKNVPQRFDAFVVGSDQVWNPQMMFTDATYFPAPAHCLTISYAASLGVANLPKQQTLSYRQMLAHYQAISVRETSAQRVLAAVTRRSDIQVVLDPTLLLSATDWQKLARAPKHLPVNNRYILCYFLGHSQAQSDIITYAKQRHYQIINLLDPHDPFYHAGPAEFIYLIQHAQLVCTDSFHACVFSTIFQTPFTVFQRNGEWHNLYARITDFLTHFRLTDHEYHGNLAHHQAQSNCAVAHQIIAQDRQASLEFLRQNLPSATTESRTQSMDVNSASLGAES